MRKESYSDLTLFQVAVCGLPSLELFSILEWSSQCHSKLLLKSIQPPMGRSYPPFGINYRMVTIPDLHTNLE
ncbi:MAG: hypothetical protein ACFFB3_20895, partial [Candidatus Hodarchaeota archaeon]